MTMDHDEIREALKAMRARDLPTHGGRTLAYVYDSGLASADAIGREALAAFASTNGLDPTASRRCSRWRTTSSASRADSSTPQRDSPACVTSGGTESILLAVLAARDARPDDHRTADGPADDGTRGLPQGRALAAGRAGPRRRRPRDEARRPRGDGRRHRRPDRPRRRLGPVLRARRHRPRRADRRSRRGRRGALPRRRLHRRLGAAPPARLRARAASVDVRRRRA